MLYPRNKSTMYSEWIYSWMPETRADCISAASRRLKLIDPEGKMKTHIHAFGYQVDKAKTVRWRSEIFPLVEMIDGDTAFQLQQARDLVDRAAQMIPEETLPAFFEAATEDYVALMSALADGRGRTEWEEQDDPRRAFAEAIEALGLAACSDQEAFSQHLRA